MKRVALVLLIIAVVAQLAVPASMIWKREQTLRHGRVWKFRTAPVDPVDAFRGRYVALRFEAGEVRLPGRERVRATPAWVRLAPDAEGFAQVVDVSDKPLPGADVMKVKSTYWFEEDKQHVHWPFDRLWLDERIAPEAENAYFAMSNRKERKAWVTVRAHGDDAAVEDLYLDGKPLREYLAQDNEK